MHKLQRPELGPDVLLQAKAKKLSWDEFWDKGAVSDALAKMQGNRCAYCEGALEPGEGHIEHFRRKAQGWFPEFTFEWSNLFYSCMREKTCGRHKDKSGVLLKDQVPLLLDPCRDNPEDFLVFTADGGVSPRLELSDRDRRRAELTIEVFNLRDPTLRIARKNECAKYAWMIDAQLLPEEVDELLMTSEISQYITAVYHYLGKRVDECC